MILYNNLSFLNNFNIVSSENVNSQFIISNSAPYGNINIYNDDTGFDAIEKVSYNNIHIPQIFSVRLIDSINNQI